MNDNTSYREKGRALFLAAIMVISVVAMSAAFAGSAAATTPQETSLSNIEGELVYEGVTYNVSDGLQDVGPDEVDLYDEETVYLVEVDDTEDGNVTEASTVRPISVQNHDSGGASTSYFELDLDGLDDGAYAISDQSGSSGDFSDAFDVVVQGFDVEWDEDEVTETDNEVEFEIDSDNRVSQYNISIWAEDLDYDEINATFNHDDNDIVNELNETDLDHIPIGSLAGEGLDVDPSDRDFEDVEDEGVVTFELDDSFDFGGDDLIANFTNLDEAEGLPEGDFDFNVMAADTGATASDEITIREDDAEAEFTQGVYTQTAGDLVYVTVDFEDTDETWIQVGDEDAGFVDVVYVADDGGEDGQATFTMNTRVIGTDADTSEGAAYFSGDDEVQSYFHSPHSGDEVHDAEFYDDSDVEDELTDGYDGYGEYLDELNIISDEDDWNAQLTRPLQATDYDLVATSNGKFIAEDGESDVDDEIGYATLDLTQPGLDDIETHVAYGEDANDEVDLEELNELLYERTDVAKDDRLVVQADAPALSGYLSYLDAGDTYDYTNEHPHDGFSEGFNLGVLGQLMEADEGFELEIGADDATGNQEPTSVDFDEIDGVDEDDAVALYNVHTGQLYIVIDTSADDDVFTRSLTDDMDFTATLTYETDDDERYALDRDNNGDIASPLDGAADGDGDSAFPYFLADSTEEVSTEFTVVEPAVEFDNLDADENVQIEAGEEVEITGETNVAPGSDADIRVTNAGDTPSFLNTEDAEIDADGTFASDAIDFSDRGVDDEAEIEFRVGGSTIGDADGIFVEELDDDADDEEPPEEDDDEPPAEDDDEPPETDDDPAPPTDDTADDTADDTEDDGVPGFGLAIAVVALLAAAMLALRRQN